MTDDFVHSAAGTDGTGPLHNPPARFSVIKLFDDLPCTHRSWAHDGKCSFLHGYERRFEIEFGCGELEPKTGFVIDFSALKEVRALLQGQFDHTTLIAAGDPQRELFEELGRCGVIDLRIMDHTGMEGAAEWVHGNVDRLVRERTAGRVRVLRVVARESRKNAVVFQAPDPWGRM
ncbi:6-pyruvoyl trahydropterin synthase family protein [Sphaerimonospora sp. CA-214678]|uniref:6-pyruvoyl trahydropterin synthase family protein n=1 Tax=Sphaerimonospora sp. CA-214678 TaxID=3240029 RepID=UPI003D89CF62